MNTNMNNAEVTSNEATVSNGGNLKSFLRNERIERVMDGGKTRQRVLLPKALVRSQRFMDRFFAETGWHWLDAVAETRACARA